MQLKIKHKLFAAIVIANLVVILGIYLLSNWSFSSSFREYLDANKQSQLRPLLPLLSQKFQ